MTFPPDPDEPGTELPSNENDAMSTALTPLQPLSNDDVSTRHSGKPNSVPSELPPVTSGELDAAPSGPHDDAMPTFITPGNLPIARDAGSVARSDSNPRSALRSSTSSRPRTVSGTVRFVPGVTIFDKYRVIGLLGQGGMGEVWRVHDEGLDDDRAIKLIRRTTTGLDEDAIARFWLEARVMAKIKNPHAVTVHEIHLDQHDAAYIVMEYVEGESLEKVLHARKTLPLAFISRLVSQVCSVLEVAHKQKIIHRDLKPSNLMLVAGGPEGEEQFKVLDFGIAKVQGQDDSPESPRTQARTFLGTPPYTSPEQSLGRSEPSSDIYSLGIILYELITGRRPFRGEFLNLITDTMKEPPPPFATTNPAVSVPPEVEALVMACLAKAPADRPRTARELSDLFQAAIAPPIDAPPHVPSRTEVRRKQFRAVMLGSALAVPLSAVILLFVINPTRKSNPSVIGEQNEQKPRLDGYYRFRDVYLPAGYAPETDSGEPLVEGRWPATIVRKSDKVRFIRVPGGAFVMGAQVEVPGGKYPMESEVIPHQVELTGFYIQKCEVTNGEMEAFLRENSDLALDPVLASAWRENYRKMTTSLPAGRAQNHPAAFIPWPLADEFARRRQGNLPTEAQFEFATHSAGLVSPFIWPKKDDDQLSTEKLANINSLQNDFGTQEVCIYEHDSTLLGVMDLAGNVREWARDVSRPYDPKPVKDPQFPPERNDSRPIVVRGGSFLTSEDFRYVTARGESVPLDTKSDIGFRIVLECPEDRPPL